MNREIKIDDNNISEISITELSSIERAEIRNEDEEPYKEISLDDIIEYTHHDMEEIAKGEMKPYIVYLNSAITRDIQKKKRRNVAKYVILGLGFIVIIMLFLLVFNIIFKKNEPSITNEI